VTTRTAGGGDLLNRPGFESTAAVAWVVHASEGAVWGTVTVSDCYRAVKLNLGGSAANNSRESFENSMHKLEVLQRNIDQAIAALRDAGKEAFGDG